MAFTFSIKEIRDGSWHHISLDYLAGKTWLQALQAFEGVEAVAEFIFDDKKIYFCGTEKWLNRMSVKGKALRFSQVNTLINDNDQSTWLNEKVPFVEAINSFLGGEIQRHEVK